MYGAGQQAFRQFDCESRYVIRDTCARPPELPSLFAAWGSRAHFITSESRRAATAQKTPKPESWRLTSVIPTAATKGPAIPGWPSVTNTTPTNTVTTTTTNNESSKNKEANPTTTSPLPAKLPPPWNPALWPTLDRILHPWEAPESPIEYAVSHFLRKESPELYGKLVDFALRYSGVVPEGFDTSFLTNPVGTTTTDGTTAEYQLQRDATRSTPGANNDSKRENQTKK